ncbi:hypothetical protein RB2467 [Rhodopirellula baltica SH 1]|uniref:Uncharacterized protein n=1 Tax=Rhodopirellula baltica (strain DSM 10527 / NCIMB 13988 / SH1) TaxID=243090 RepID=Q7UVS6_RHOBA|nr:hypothetical protein RB2467 [Rhodopirellula baltica SH 1]
MESTIVEQLSATVPQIRSKLRPSRANRLHPEKWHRHVSLFVPHIFSETLALGIQAVWSQISLSRNY